MSASAVKLGGPTAMNIPGLAFGSGNPRVMRRAMYCAYINVATINPKPWNVSPATRIFSECATGWSIAMVLAIVPESMMGKMGSIHEGVILCRSMCRLDVKSW